jgi:GT2 family glycosyltransferase
VDSTSVLMDREKFLQLGFLDEDLFLYYDEMDFCLRAAIRKGWKCLYLPGSVVYHGYGSEVSSFRGEKVRFPAFRAYLMTKNRILVMLKCYQARTLVAILPMLIFFEILTLGFHARHGVLAAYFKGVAWNLRNLPRTLAKRRELQRARMKPDRALLSAEIITVNPRLHASRLETAIYNTVNRMISGYWRLTLGGAP